MPNQEGSIVDRVIRHLESTDVDTLGIRVADISKDRVLDIARISKGAVVVYLNVRRDDSSTNRRWDVYVEADRYRVKRYGGKVLEGLGLRVLTGISRFPPIGGFYDALEFAKKELEPETPEYDWFDAPIFID